MFSGTSSITPEFMSTRWPWLSIPVEVLFGYTIFDGESGWGFVSSPCGIENLTWDCGVALSIEYAREWEFVTPGSDLNIEGNPVEEVPCRCVFGVDGKLIETLSPYDFSR